MAEVAFLHYRPGRSLLHRLPGWVKLTLMMTLSLAAGYAPPPLLAAVTALLLAATFPIKPALTQMKGSLLFMLIMAALLGGSEWRLEQDLNEALLRGGRFILIFWAGLLFTTCAHPAEIGEAFRQLTGWIPFFPSERLKIHITLTLTFFPLIMDESATVDRAARSRCFHRRKNPLIRLRYRVEPLIGGIYRKSDHISRAMAARCYGKEKK
ncbi:MAG: energy-coupling factor transporter transmembrane protein EcfT [Spirochaetales bacterium]|nr:energy-coupling factor transporter transmembrane protein EcfT [Spirochaetales bacterium]